MRVAFLSMQQAFLDALFRHQGSLARLQEQVATGRKFARPGQDPVAATEALGLDAVLARNASYLRNGSQALSRLGLEEGALAGMGDVLQRVRELTVQAANGPLPAGDRAMIAAEVRELRAQLLSLANSQDGSGAYLFAGNATQSAPFLQSGGSVAYLGDQGQRLVQIGLDRFVADGDHGAGLLMQVPDGDGVFRVVAGAANTGTGLLGQRGVVDAAQYDGGTYSIVFTAPDAWEARDALGTPVATGTWVPGEAVRFRGLGITLSGQPATGDRFEVSPSSRQSVFAMLDDLVAALEAGATTPTARTALANDFADLLGGLDQALDHLLEARAGIGARMGAIESQEESLQAAGIDLQRTLSGLRDTDYAAALTRLQQELTTLEAAQQSFARTAGLSLFDYL
jgi:flagellar hook-associated protein 3 FlgL